MIYLSDNLQLKSILSSESSTLFKLMEEVYPLAYSHFWKDKGVWYVNSQYSKENILKELSVKNADYYFIVFNNEIVGNFRIIWDEKLEGISEKKQVKLHRIYLHKKTQGNGIGKKILLWLENKSKEKGYKIIWLDAMDEQPQAFNFYKKQGYKYHSHTFLPFDLLYDKVRKMSQIFKILD
ncbi:GNAT family N-acetyltransferase [Polaribacter sargassicola]|uniref:GNAT family N-acetyltransferase n=1 Tax=Polaribacter sargassicola TaxID=2836891 RepID=UPI001F24BDCD|nr:GNAT family N-acetyltransferase [Polaribacter sp. DS7-9]MCG1035098.1 GNAT family N-acetyltransferase [Polaribacter sp. DS7-9]